MSDLQRKIVEFELFVQRRENYTSKAMGDITLDILTKCVEEANSSEIETELLKVTRRLQEAVHCDVIVTNYCNRIINFLNEELDKKVPFVFSQPNSTDVRRSQSMSLIELFSQPKPAVHAIFESSGVSLKTNLLQEIENIRNEIPEIKKKVDKNAVDYIHNEDVVMTVGYSQTILSFFGKASTHRKFCVLIPEHAPSYDGIKMAQELRKFKSIEVSVIPDSAVFAMMPRITTVFIPVRAVFADGTLITTSFVQSVALAARHHSKPVVVIYWKVKLTERFFKPHDSYTVLSSPNEVVPIDDPLARIATILNPEGECIPGKIADLMINEDGPHDPADIFQQVQESYHPD